jgi:hypothetical protein
MFRPGALLHKTHEGTSERLIQLAMGYFGTYVITGSLVKFFLSSKGMGMTGIEFLVYSTLISSLFCVSLVIYWKWYKFKSNNYTTFIGINMPKEFLYIIPSGVLTAIIIPTTTLLYTFDGVSVMAAMIIMRGSVIIVSRIVDTIQIKQGLLKKNVYWQENIGFTFALLAIVLKLIFVDKGSFDFIHNFAFVSIFLAYIFAYAIRIYIMNYYKNTRPKDAIYDYKGFFGIEQISASLTLIISMIVILLVTASPETVIGQFQAAVHQPHEKWFSAVFAGIPYGIGAFFSVFLFMFQGRTATFAGLTNRLTSLIAGTVATLVVWQWLAKAPPSMLDWGALALILTAVYFLGLGEKRRTAELLKAHEIVEEED